MRYRRDGPVVLTVTYVAASPCATRDCMYPNVGRACVPFCGTRVPHGTKQSIDDAFFERDVEMLELAFDGQMHFGCFYAYVKLKEQVKVSQGQLHTL